MRRRSTTHGVRRIVGTRSVPAAAGTTPQPSAESPCEWKRDEKREKRREVRGVGRCQWKCEEKCEERREVRGEERGEERRGEMEHWLGERWGGA